MKKYAPEVYFTATILLVAALALAFIGSLVAEPKALFGRALSAIPPTLFPTLVLAALVILAALLLVLLLRNPTTIYNLTGLEGWRRGALFFGIMTVYALSMAPFGFLISTAIATVLMSLLTGNRSIWQIAVLSVGGPVLLYLAATRLLAVSLPELNTIELFYARFF